MDRINGALGQFRALVGMESAEDELVLDQEQDLSFMDEFNRSCTLSRTQVFFTSHFFCALLGPYFPCVSGLLRPCQYFQ